MRANERGKGWKGAAPAPPEYLNAPTSHDNSHPDGTTTNREGANLAPPGGGAEEGGELPPT